MAKTILVDGDVSAGELLISRLRQAGVDIQAAFWFFLHDPEEWKLFVVTPQAGPGAQDLYVAAIQADVDMDLTLVRFTTSDDPLVGAVVRATPRGDKSAVRISKTLYKGVFIDDALVYRLAA